MAGAPSRGFRNPNGCSPHYDLSALSVEAGNSEWGGGEDPRAGAEALLVALADPMPPRRLILGQAGVAVVELHDGRRQAERRKWLCASQLEGVAQAAG